VHPRLGTLDDFRRLLDAARRQGLEIALDFASQCSPDHPWVRQHPDWFERRPDGSLKPAENPPRRYDDIVDIRLYGAALPEAWYALRDAVLFWAEQGVRLFRVDRPQARPFPFWEWLIGEVQAWYPDVLFLAKALTRAKAMRKLAKLGFAQSYTDFMWRSGKAELTALLTELTATNAKDVLRPNLFVNSAGPDPAAPRPGGAALHQVRAVLASTLSSAWGMSSGFELCEEADDPVGEIYAIRARNWDAPGHIRETIARLNRIRRDNPALQALTNLRFYEAGDDNILFYGKMTPSRDNIILVAVNLDPKAPHGATIVLPWEEMGAGGARYVEAEELLRGGTVRWTGRTQEIVLDPAVNPCAIWRVFVPGESAARGEASSPAAS
jgi:starch synthase (maltosyl-transferring)